MPARVFTLIFAVLSAAAIMFAVLWLREREHNASELTQGGTKDIIKEVEVSAKLTEKQKAAIDFAARYESAPMVKSVDEAFYKVQSVSVQVLLSDGVKKFVSEDRVKNKFELILRQHGIRLDDASPTLLAIRFEGIFVDEAKLLSYTYEISLTEIVTIGRMGDLRGVTAAIWRKGAYGYAGQSVAEKSIMDDVESMGEDFANKFLATQDKEAQKNGHK